MLYNKNSVSSEALIRSNFRYSISEIKSQTVPCCFVHGSPVCLGDDSERRGIGIGDDKVLKTNLDAEILRITT
jgi:hypothetical protein